MSEPLLDLPLAAWPEFFTSRGGARFHAAAAARWILRGGVSDWEQMTDLPASLRARLAAEAPLRSLRLEQASNAGDGAMKVLLRLPDGAAVEAVGMAGKSGPTFCISTQVGCPVRCRFCASGDGGLERNLSRGEILEQVLWLAESCGPPRRLVVMGMGDPGFNLEATLAALDTLLDGAVLGARRVTLSTVAPRGTLARIAAWGRPVTLALSLHAPDDALRRSLIPALRARSVVETLDEADALFAAVGREYTVEYVLLAEVNDAPAQAESLGRLLAGRRCHVNLIPYNVVAGLGYARPAPARQQAFAAALRRHGLSVTLRRSLGGAVDAACGQLRRRTLAPS